jgi:hypothetical protein
MSHAQHPSGAGTYFLSQALQGSRPPQDLTACDDLMVVHRAVDWERHDNGVIDWKAGCGVAGYTTGTLGHPHHATPEMFCPDGECFALISRRRK